MWSADPEYPTQMAGTVPQYTLERVVRALEAADVQAPATAQAVHSAASVFAGYLVLDAWVANQDRHHGNWAVLEDQLGGQPPTLAPSFDHGSSLGFQLRDAHRDRLVRDGDAERWARKGVCRPMAGRPNLVKLAHDAVKAAGAAAQSWLERLATIRSDNERAVVEAIPSGRMSFPRSYPRSDRARRQSKEVAR